MLAHPESMAPLFLHHQNPANHYAPPTFDQHMNYYDRFASAASTSSACMMQGGAGNQPSTSRMAPQPYNNNTTPMQSRQPMTPNNVAGNANMSPTPGMNVYNLPIKSEPVYDQMYDASDNESHYSSGTTSQPLLSSGGSTGGLSRPRKYRIKPECERKKPEYKLKRAKNNDAVRRSRDKAKRLQIEKEQRLDVLEKTNAELSKLVEQLRKRNEILEREMVRRNGQQQQQQQQCTCGGTAGASNFAMRR